MSVLWGELIGDAHPELEVHHVSEYDPRMLDEDVLHLAWELGAVVITRDSDLPTLVYKEGHAARGIVFVRGRAGGWFDTPELTLLNHLLARQPGSLEGWCVTLARGRARWRELP